MIWDVAGDPKLASYLSLGVVDSFVSFVHSIMRLWPDFGRELAIMQRFEPFRPYGRQSQLGLVFFCVRVFLHYH